MMRFLFLTALLIVRLSLVAQTGQYCFSKLDIYSVVSHNQVNTILKDAEGFVWLRTMPGLAVMMDIDVNFFTSNMMIVPRPGANWNFVMTGSNFFPS